TRLSSSTTSTVWLLPTTRRSLPPLDRASLDAFVIQREVASSAGSRGWGLDPAHRYQPHAPLPGARMRHVKIAGSRIGDPFRCVGLEPRERWVLEEERRARPIE